VSRALECGSNSATLPRVFSRSAIGVVASRAACHPHSTSPTIIRGDFRKMPPDKIRFMPCDARRYFSFHLKMKMSPENRGFRDSRHCLMWNSATAIASGGALKNRARRLDLTANRDVLSRVIAAESCACFAAREWKRLSIVLFGNQVVFVARFGVNRGAKVENGGRMLTPYSAQQTELIEKYPCRTMACDESTIRVACYFVQHPSKNGLYGTVPSGSFVACADAFGNCDVATEGGIRGRPVLGGSLKSLAFMRVVRRREAAKRVSRD